MQAEQPNLRSELQKRINQLETVRQLSNISTPEEIAERRIRVPKKFHEMDRPEEQPRVRVVALRIQQQVMGREEGVREEEKIQMARREKIQKRRNEREEDKANQQNTNKPTQEKSIVEKQQNNIANKESIQQQQVTQNHHAFSLFSKPEDAKEFTGPSVKMDIPITGGLFFNPRGKISPSPSHNNQKPAATITTNTTELFSNNPSVKSKESQQPAPAKNIFGASKGLSLFNQPQKEADSPKNQQPLLFPKASPGKQIGSLFKFEAPPPATTNIFARILQNEQQKTNQSKKQSIFGNILSHQTKDSEIVPPTPSSQPKLNIFGQPVASEPIATNFKPANLFSNLNKPTVESQKVTKEVQKPKQEPPKQKTIPVIELKAQNQESKPVQPAVKPAESLFSKPATSIFDTPKLDLFNPNPEQSKPAFSIFTNTANQGSIFGNALSQEPSPKFSLFDSSKPSVLFPSPSAPVPAPAPTSQGLYNFGAPTQTIKPPPIQEEQGQEGDDAPLQDTDTANPTLSTGRYVYEETTEVIVKSEGNHFRKNDGQQVFREIVVSLEKTKADGKHNVLVRSIRSKNIIYQGLVLPSQTKAEYINNNKQNVKIIKLISLENGKPRPDLLKIQFRDAQLGESFVNALEKCL